MKLHKKEVRDLGGAPINQRLNGLMSVLREIFQWSQNRPNWQRDALRRLIVNGELSDDDVRDLSEICKSAHGLAEQQ